MRVGTFVKQIEGYRAFIPTALPPAPPIEFDAELIQLVSKADQLLIFNSRIARRQIRRYIIGKSVSVSFER